MFKKIIRKLFFKYCYTPQTINASRYNVIPINSFLIATKEMPEDLVKEKLSKIMADEIMKVIRIDKYIMPNLNIQYRTRMFIAEDKRG